MEQSLDGTADHTISLLEARLRRIEYVVIGEKTEIKTEQATTATERLRDLEIALDRILAKSKASQDLLRLRMFFKTRAMDPLPYDLTLSRSPPP